MSLSWRKGKENSNGIMSTNEKRRKEKPEEMNINRIEEEKKQRLILHEKIIFSMF